VVSFGEGRMIIPPDSIPPLDVLQLMAIPALIHASEDNVPMPPMVWMTLVFVAMADADAFTECFEALHLSPAERQLMLHHRNEYCLLVAEIREKGK
jgi:hypothetical protein